MYPTIYVIVCVAIWLVGGAFTRRDEMEEAAGWLVPVGLLWPLALLVGAVIGTPVAIVWCGRQLARGYKKKPKKPLPTPEPVCPNCLKRSEYR